jgi:hypothetical protein
MLAWPREWDIGVMNMKDLTPGVKDPSAYSAAVVESFTGKRASPCKKAKKQ